MRHWWIDGPSRARFTHAPAGYPSADSTLAASLLSIAQDQLRAGTGVGLDVTDGVAGHRAEHAPRLVTDRGSC